MRSGQRRRSSVTWAARKARWRFALAALALWPPISSAAQPDDVIGLPRVYVTRAEDTLLDIARDNDLGYVEMRAAFPGIDPWLPGAGRKLILPTQHVLPDAPRRGIVINLPELRLYFYEPGQAPRSFPLGIG